MIDTSRLSDTLIRKMHDAIREADEEDTAWRDAGGDPDQKHSGTRIYSDWRETRDTLESEMKKRDMDFDHIDLG